ncbi:phage tail protein [Bradyrhizobium sp. B120]|uniref:phage tail protein n=1 Tax=Bradyrhizobium sp. B120 TaxID=3410088 RepID=UPI003B9808D4
MIEEKLSARHNRLGCTRWKTRYRAHVDDAASLSCIFHKSYDVFAEGLMADPFLSEIRMMTFNFAPKGWAFCNGQLLPLNQNQPLFSLLGTVYGGNGQTNFALPNLQGRTPMHVGNGHVLGELGGEQAHTLSINEMPQHTHVANATNTNGALLVPANNVLGALNNAYAAPAALTALAPGSISTVGGSQAHQNMQPFLTINFCIALQGIFPSPN